MRRWPRGLRGHVAARHRPWKDTMAKVWVLDTSTKGTGATMVPLDSVLRKPSGRAEPIYVPPPTPPKEPAPEQPRSPRRFKIVDVRSRVLLGEDVTARAAIATLRGVQSIVDVTVYVLEPDEAKWRLLTFDEQRLLWSLRDTPSATGQAASAASGSPGDPGRADPTS
jgi:hypothetical protein